MQFSTYATMPHQQPINTCHISIHLTSAATSSCMVKNFKIIYLTHTEYDIHFKLCFRRCVLPDEINKTS
jgi:hypothetical protein